VADGVLYGYAGQVLHAHLTRQQFNKEPLSRLVLRKYVGGTGLGARFLCEQLPPGVEMGLSFFRRILGDRAVIRTITKRSDR